MCIQICTDPYLYIYEATYTYICFVVFGLCSRIQKCAATNTGAKDTHAPAERGSNVD